MERCVATANIKMADSQEAIVTEVDVEAILQGKLSAGIVAHHYHFYVMFNLLG